MSLAVDAEGVEWASADFRDQRFSPHRHETYAIGFTTRGVQRFAYRGTVWYALPGDVFVLHPDEVHDGAPGGEEGFGYRIAYVEPELLRRAAGAATPPFTPDGVRRDRWACLTVPELFAAADGGRSGLERVDRLVALAAVAGGRFDMVAPSGRAVREDPVMLRVREKLADEFREGVTAAALETEFGLDRFALSRRFRRQFGLAPGRFQALRRLDCARHAIEDGETLAVAAAEAGFADQSHMTRRFRAAFGLTPGRWQSLVRG